MDFRDLHKNAKRIGLDLMHPEAFRDDRGDRMSPACKHPLRQLDDDQNEARSGRPSPHLGRQVFP